MTDPDLTREELDQIERLADYVGDPAVLLSPSRVRALVRMARAYAEDRDDEARFRPICGADNPTGSPFICALSPMHAGPHIAFAPDGDGIISTWEEPHS